MRNLSFSAAGITLALLVGAQQPATSQEREPENTLTGCRAISDKDARLACYDALPVNSATDRTSKSIRESKRADFGLSERQRQSEEALPTTVDSPIRELRVGSDGKRVLTLANGQVWAITSDGRLGRWLEVGQSAHITAGFMSGYRLTVDGVKGIAVVHRLR